MQSKIVDLATSPFIIVEAAVLESKLSPYEKLLIIALKRFAGRTDRAWPGEKTLARLVSCTDRQIRKCLRSLQEKRLIDIIPRPGGTNIYLLPGYELQGDQLVGIWPEEVDLRQILGPERCPSKEPERPEQYSGGRNYVPGGGNDIPGGAEPRSAEKYINKNNKKNIYISLSRKSCTKTGRQQPTPKPSPEEREIFEEWEKIFKKQLPATLLKHPSSSLCCDYMLYLAREHRLPKLRSPIGYLRRLLEAPPAPEDFESLRDYKERLRREREEQERRTREELRRREEAEQIIREWQALPETERQKWLEAARKHEMSQWISLELVARMLWHQEVRKQKRLTKAPESFSVAFQPHVAARECELTVGLP